MVVALFGTTGAIMGQAQEMVFGLTLALLLGVVGQGVRVIAGLKKLAEEAAGKGQTISEDFVWTRFALSLATGAIAGALAFLGYWFGGPTEGADPTKAPVLFGIIAAGYAGTDFIEAFVRKHLPQGAGAAAGSANSPKQAPAAAGT